MRYPMETARGTFMVEVRAGWLVKNGRRIFKVQHPNSPSIRAVVRRTTNATPDVRSKILEALTGEVYGADPAHSKIRLQYAATMLCHKVSQIPTSGQMEEAYRKFVLCDMADLKNVVESTDFIVPMKSKVKRKNPFRTITRAMVDVFELTPGLESPTPITFTHGFPIDGSALSKHVVKHQIRPGFLPIDLEVLGIEEPGFVRDIAPLKRVSATAWLVCNGDDLLAENEYYEEGELVLAEDWEIMAWIRHEFWETGNGWTDKRCGTDFKITHLSWYRSQWRKGALEGQTGPGVVSQPPWRKILKTMNREGLK